MKILINLQPEDVAIADAIARRETKSRSSIVRIALRYWFAQKQKEILKQKQIDQKVNLLTDNKNLLWQGPVVKK